MTARRRGQRRRNFAGDVMEGKMTLADPGHSVEEKPRVGMRRIAEDFITISQLHQTPQIHDGHPVGDVANYADIMTDEQAGQIELVAQLHENVEDLRLNGNVQRSDGFVAYQYAGRHGQSPGYTYALTLASGKLVRITAFVAGIKPDLKQQLVNEFVQMFGRDQLMYQRRVTYYVSDAHTGIERGKGILKNHLQLEL